MNVVALGCRLLAANTGGHGCGGRDRDVPVFQFLLDLLSDESLGLLDCSKVPDYGAANLNLRCFAVIPIELDFAVVGRHARGLIVACGQIDVPESSTLSSIGSGFDFEVGGSHGRRV